MASVDKNTTVDGQGACTTTPSSDPSPDQPPPPDLTSTSGPTTTSPSRTHSPAIATSASNTYSLDNITSEAPAVHSLPTTTTTSATSATTDAVAAAPAPEFQQNGGSTTTESEGQAEMSNHRHPPIGSPHGPATYPPPPPLSSSSISYPHQPTSGHFSSYPSPSVQQPSDVYRASPAASSPMTLPSMRTIDPMAQSHPQAMGPTSNLNAPMGSSPGSAPSPFYPVPQTSSLASSYGIAPENMTRYAALPHNPNSPHNALHRAPKKEIKRRTKTGCLTCRKRRIKCDEGHPTCNNCKKSRRDCLGYDPIFRQQTVNVAQNYNTSPATASASVATATHSQSTPSALPPSDPPRILPPPTAHHQSVSHSHLGTNSYGSQPAASLNNYSSNGPNGPLPPPALGPSTSSPYLSTAIKGEAPGIKPEPSSAFPSVTPANGSDHRILPPPNSGPDGSRSSHPLRAEKMKIDQIIDLLGPPPPAHQIQPTEEAFTEITKVYHEMYAAGLSAFFETNWYYFTEGGKMSFPRDPKLIENLTSFLKILESVKANDHAQMTYSGALETRIVWQLAHTASWATSDKTSNTMRVTMPAEGDPVEARNRLQVVETLLCGEYLASNPLAPPLQDRDALRSRQFDFWYQLGEFVRRRDQPSAPANVKAREDALARMRRLLDGRENRDVLYSIAVVRELAPQFEANYASSVPPHLDETDPKNRLAVASKFIIDESQVTGGTTNVVRRFSDIAARAFVNPGVNIARNPSPSS